MVDLIVSALADLIASALEAIIDWIAPIFSFDFSAFIDLFPYAAAAYKVLQDFALGLALILAAWSLIPFIFNMNQAKSSPVRTLLFTVLAVAGIYYGNYVLEWIVEIADAPYQALLNLDATHDAGIGTALDGKGGVISAALSSAFMGTSVLLYIILLLMVGISFVKLLLEAVERYLVLCAIVYLSPLAFATMASESSFGVFKKFFSLFLSQCILLILTIWSVEMGLSMFENLGQAPGGSPAVGLLIGYAFLRIAGRLDSYLNQVGLNTAVTGLGLGNELMATGMMLMSKGGKMSGGAGGSGGSGSSGGIVGAANRISSGLKKISPIQPAVNKAAAGIKSVAGAGAAGVKAWANKVGTGGSLAAGTKAAAASLKSGLAKNMRNAKLTNQGNNLWSRGLYSKIHGAVDPKKLTNSERANHAYFADQAFNSAAAGGAANNDPAAVASTAAGIGIGQADPEGEELVNVGLGNTDAENVNFALDKDGVHANYDANGLHHDWDIKNASQYAKLDAEQQAAYTGFKASNGQQMYYKHTATNNQARLQRQVSTPTVGSPMTASDWNSFSHLPQERRESALVGATDHMETNNAKLVGGEATPYLRATIQSLSNTAISSSDRSFCLNALDQGQATDLRFDGSGGSFSVVNPDNGHTHSFSILTNLPSNGDAAERNYNEGYRSSVMGDRNWGFKATETDRDGNIVSGKSKR